MESLEKDSETATPTDRTATSSDETVMPSDGNTGETPSTDSSDNQGVHAYNIE